MDTKKFLEYLALQNAKNKGVPLDVMQSTGIEPTPPPSVVAMAPESIPETNPQEAPQPNQVTAQSSSIEGLMMDRLNKPELPPVTQVDLTPNSSVPSLEPELIEAQKQAEKERVLARLGSGADIASRAIIGAEKNDQIQDYYKGVIVDSEIPVKEFQQKVVIRDKEKDLMLDDPTSEVSQMYRLALAKAMPTTDFTKLENLSARQIEKMFPTLKASLGVGSGSKGDDMMAVIRALQRERDLNQNDTRIGQADKRGVNLEKQRDWTKEQKDEPEASQVKHITEIDGVIDGLDKTSVLKESLSGFVTGPLAGRVERIKAFIGAQSGARAALQAQIRKSLSDYGKAISGAAIAEQEMVRLEQQLPQDTDNAEVFATKLSNFRDSFINSRLRLLDNIEKSGRNVDKFKTRTAVGDLSGSGTGSQSPTEQGKTVARKGFNSKTNKTQLIYSDGTKEIVDGKR